MAAFARKRLLRDLAEVQREPSELVAAGPLEDDLFEWHVNLRPSSGPLAGVVLHLRIVFPEDYPNSPPNMLFPFEALPSFVHPNLYSFGLCLDILQSYVGERVDRAGWSTSYTVRTILLQLQSFLFEFDAAPQDHGGTYSCRYSSDRISRVRAESTAMSCACGHCGAAPWPPLIQPTASSHCADSDPRPSLSAELKSVRADIVKAEACVAKAQRLPKEVALVRNTAYLSAGDEPKIFRAAVSKFHLRIVRVQGDGRCAYARTGFSAVSEESSLRFFLTNTQPADKKCKDLRMIQAKGTDFSEHGNTWAVLVLRNVQICVETQGYSFWEGAVPREASQAQLRRQVEEEATRSAELLPTLQAREQSLLQQLLQQREQAALRRQQTEWVRLQAEEDDLAKPLHDGAAKSAWATLCPDMLLQIFMHLDVVETTFLQRTCKVWWRLCTRCSLAERIELSCFFTKAKAREDILGFGIAVSYHDDGNIKEVGTELDVISAGAFYEQRVRRGAWGSDFAHFLPLVLDVDHARRAVPALKKAMASVVLRRPAAEFEPWMALAVLPQVMNSFVVSLMKSEELDDFAEAAVPRHASEKALLGYCSFHHMLLALCARHPEIGDVAADRLRRFIRGQRSKADVPDLGQLLVYMAIAEDVQWEDLAAAVLAESQVRGVRWLLRDRPSLECVVAVEDRLRWTFQGRATSSRLLMFQAFFLRSVARPAGETLAASLARYNHQFGQPTGPQKERLVHACREILRADAWPAVYEGLGLQMPAEEALAEELCAAVQRSRQLGYHGGPTLLHGGKSALPERVGVKKCLKQAFQEMELQKMRERAGARQCRRAPVPPKQVRPEISRGGFAALQEDSDEESGSD